MAAQLGQNMLLKVKKDSLFLTVAGLKAREIEFNMAPVDITDSDSAGRWRELLSGGGVRKARLSGEGIFRDASADAQIRSLFFDGETNDWQITLPDFGRLEGSFIINSLSYAGKFDGEVTWHMQLESSGEISFAEI